MTDPHPASPSAAAGATDDPSPEAPPAVAAAGAPPPAATPSVADASADADVDAPPETAVAAEDLSAGVAAGDAGPLGELALAFSGGGYRAAAFHLGALRMVHRMGLMRDVVALSTVSGGSIVGAAWVLSVVQGKSFEAFDAGFTAYLRDTNVIRDAMEHLTSHRTHGHPSYPSLIRSASRVYARPELFGATLLGDIHVPLEAPAGPRLREVIFNSTEFRTGVDFRFRRSVNRRALVGNFHLRVPAEVADQVMLADAVAASSCFPGGFEPYLFPQQFQWTSEAAAKAVADRLGEPFKDGVPLMDGGIWDNQGVDSLLLAFERGAVTLLVSDVAARNENIYPFPAARRRGWLTLRMASLLAWVLLGASVVSAGLLAWSGLGEWRETGAGGWFLFRFGIPFAYCAGIAAVLVWLRFVIAEVQTRLREQVQVTDVWHDVARLTVQEALTLVDLRVGSLLALTSTLFMKRIRSLVFSGMAHDPAYQGKWMANYIYAMDRDSDAFAAHPWLAPSPVMRALAKEAEAMPTTLWFDSEAQMKMVIRAGEATTCFILLKYIVTYLEARLDDPASPVSELYARLRKEWAVVNT